MKRDVTPPAVIAEECIGCEQCVRVCPSFVLDMIEGKSSVVRGEWCIGCGHCGAVCPTEAILNQGSRLEMQPEKEKARGPSPEILEVLLRERRLVRIYTRDPVPEEILNKVLDAGRYAPTGTNSQNVHYVVLTSPEQIAALQKMTMNFYERIFSLARAWFGPVLLPLVAGRKGAEYLRESLPKIEYAKEQMKEGKDRLFYCAPVVMVAHAESWDTSSSFNCSVALYHCSLMAHTLGLGCCFNGFLVNAVNRAPKIKGWLGIQEDHKCYSAMTLGFPDVRYLRFVNRDPPKVLYFK